MVHWNVDPYRWLYELRARYTLGVATATRKKADEYAEKATQWMKDNAPWQDDTGMARAGLKAFVEGGSDQAQYDTGLEKAQRRDQQILKKLNRQAEGRLNTALQRQAKYMAKTGETRTSRLPKEYQVNRKSARFRPVTSVPKKSSAVAEFERAWRSNRNPICTIRFQHDLSLRHPIWLEIAHGQRYAIIGPALQFWGTKMMNEVRSIANLKQYRDRINASDHSFRQQDDFQEHINNRTVDRDAEGRLTTYEPWSEAKRIRRKERRTEYRKRRDKVADGVDLSPEQILEQKLMRNTLNSRELKQVIDEMNRRERDDRLRRKAQAEVPQTFSLNLNRRR